MEAKLSDRSQSKPDRRIAKTKAALVQALFNQLHDRDWQAISIQRLCDAANVSRSSFYAHFTTTSELLDHMMAENFPRFSDLPKRNQNFATLDWLVDHIAENRKLYFRVVKLPISAVVMAGFKSRTKATLADEFRAMNIEATGHQLDFIVGGAIELIQGWSKTWSTKEIPVLKRAINHNTQLLLRPSDKRK